MPEAISWEDIDAFKVGGAGRGVEHFDSRRSLYNCIVSEQRIGGALYMLIEVRWFSVQGSLVAEVDGYVSKLPAADANLIPAAPGETEAAAYNRRLARSGPMTC